MFSVYMHISPSGKRYIGITSQKPKNRWNNGKGYVPDCRFGMAIKKYGWDNIQHEILFEGLSEDEAKTKEIELIALFDTTDPEHGYNVTLGGDSVVGYAQTKETRAKISKSHMGIPLSDEHRKSIGRGNSDVSRRGGGRPKGYKVSKETLLKQSEAHKEQIPWNKGKKGTPISDETRNKLREASLKYWAERRCKA